MNARNSKAESAKKIPECQVYKEMQANPPKIRLRECTTAMSGGYCAGAAWIPFFSTDCKTIEKLDEVAIASAKRQCEQAKNSIKQI